MPDSLGNRIANMAVPTLMISVVLAFVTTLWFQLAPNSFVGTCVILGSIVIYRMASIFQKYKLLIRLISLLFFLQLLVFPLAYWRILKSNPSAFNFEFRIKSFEKEQSLSEVLLKYTPEALQKEIGLIEGFLDSNDEKLKLQIKLDKKNEMVITSDYMIYAEYELNPGMRLRRVLKVKVWNSNGTFLFGHSISYGRYGKNTMKESYRSFFSKRVQELKTRLNEYSDISKDIKTRNKFWTYLKVLPYSFNVMYTSNMSPISRKANYLYTAHTWTITFISALIFVVIGMHLKHAVRKA